MEEPQDGLKWAFSLVLGAKGAEPGRFVGDDDEAVALAEAKIAASKRRHTREEVMKKVDMGQTWEAKIKELTQTVKEMEETLERTYHKEVSGRRKRATARLGREIARVRGLQCESIVRVSGVKDVNPVVSAMVQVLLGAVALAASHGLCYSPGDPTLLASRGVANCFRGLVAEGLRDASRALCTPEKQWETETLVRGVGEAAGVAVHKLSNCVDRCRWEKFESETGPGDLTQSAYCTSQNSLYVLGGFEGPPVNTVETNALWRLDLSWSDDEEKATTTTTTTRASRSSSSSSSSSEKRNKKRRPRWEKLPPIEGPRRGARMAALENGDLVVHGGIKWGQGKYGDIWRFDVRKKRWRELYPRDLNGDHQYVGRCYHALAVVGSKAYVWGGLFIDDDDDDPALVWYLDVDARSPRWTAVRTTGDVPRKARADAAHWVDTEKKALFTYGGAEDSKNFSDDSYLYKLDLQTNTWTKDVLSPGSVPFAATVSEAATATEKNSNNKVFWHFGGYSDAVSHPRYALNADTHVAQPSVSSSMYYNLTLRMVDGIWRLLAPAEGEAPPRPRAYAAAGVDARGNFVVVGGYSTMNADDTNLMRNGTINHFPGRTIWRCVPLPALSRDEARRLLRRLRSGTGRALPPPKSPPVPEKKKNDDVSPPGPPLEKNQAVPRTFEEKELVRVLRLRSATHLNGQLGYYVETNAKGRAVVALLATGRKIAVDPAVLENGLLGLKSMSPDVHVRGELPIHVIRLDSWSEACRQVVTRDLELRRRFSEAWFQGVHKCLAASGACPTRPKLCTKYDPHAPPLPRDLMHPANFFFVHSRTVSKYFDKPHEAFLRRKWDEPNFMSSKDLPMECMELYLVPCWPQTKTAAWISEPLVDETDVDAYEAHIASHRYTVAPGFGVVPADFVIPPSPIATGTSGVIDEGDAHGISEVERMIALTDLAEVRTLSGHIRRCCATDCRKCEQRQRATWMAPMFSSTGVRSTGQSTPIPKLATCKACESVWYCSPTCQKADWPRHKPECNHLKAVRDSDRAKLS